jgi:hypothetical protein
VDRAGLGDGFDFSVTVGGEEGGPAWGLVVVADRGGWVVVVTVLPGVVTVSEDAVVVVVVVVVWPSLSM